MRTGARNEIQSVLIDMNFAWRKAVNLKACCLPCNFSLRRKHHVSLHGISWLLQFKESSSNPNLAGSVLCMLIESSTTVNTTPVRLGAACPNWANQSGGSHATAALSFFVQKGSRGHIDAAILKDSLQACVCVARFAAVCHEAVRTGSMQPFPFNTSCYSTFKIITAQLEIISSKLPVFFSEFSIISLPPPTLDWINAIT